jgi:RHS repeat-associated protein
LNRRVQVSLADGQVVRYGYDVAGRRTEVRDGRGTTRYAYDALDRVTAVTEPDGRQVRYGYDAAGNRVSMTWPDGKQVRYVWDAANRLTRVEDWQGRATTYNYDASGALVRAALPNGAVSEYRYDGAGRLVSVVNRSGYQVLSGYQYVLDGVGNRVEAASYTEGVMRYEYDALYRLAGWVLPSRQQVSWSYDGVGNRLQQVGPQGTLSYSYDVADQLVSAGGTTFSYDANGNMVGRSGPGGTVSYSWDAWDRLVQVSGPAGTVRYVYDGEGHRVQQVTPAGTYNYLVDRVAPLPVVIREEGPEGTIDYVHGAGLISALGSTFQHFYQFDGVGSVVSVTDGAGALRAHYGYDPWGNPLWPDALGARNKYRFTSEPWDGASGLYHFRARYYDPALGRFLSHDPVSDPNQQGNLFEYAASNPLRFLDATGRGLFTFSAKLFGFAENASQLRAQREQAINCILYDSACDVDVAAQQYQQATLSALRQAGDVAVSGVNVVYGGPAVTGGLKTDLDPGTYGQTVSWIQRLWGFVQKGLDIRGAIEALRGSHNPQPADSPYVTLTPERGPQYTVPSLTGPRVMK